MLSKLSDYKCKNADSILKPPSKCYRPLRIYNKYIHEVVYVDCGKCPACLHKKSVELTNRVASEVKQHLYSLFFTLTYDNEHLPVMVFDGSSFVGNHPVDYDSSKRQYIYPTLSDVDEDIYSYQPVKMDIDGFAYSCKKDIQDWLKRLRINLMRSKDCVLFHGKKKLLFNKQLLHLSKNEKKIRYFICSEYGPTTFRPHYHGILFTDNVHVARFLERNISSLWSQCDSSRVDVQYVQSSAPQYVAKYCNSFTHLPKILQTKFTRPFCLASKNPIIGSYKSNREEIADILFNGTVEHLEQINIKDSAEFTYVPVSYSLLSRYFPTPQGFGLPSDYDELSLFAKYEQQRYKKVYKVNDKGKRVLDVLGSKTHTHNRFSYLNSLDYSYQDYRFYRMAKFWTSRPITYPCRVDGVLTGETASIRLSLSDYFRLLKRLYSNVKLLTLRGFYLSQECVDDVYRSKFHFHRSKDFWLLSHYPGIVRELPFALSRYEYVNDFKLNPLFAPLKQMCISFDELYDSKGTDFGYLRPELINLWNGGDLVTINFREDLIDSINKSMKKKKFNELFTDVHFNFSRSSMSNI